MKLSIALLAGVALAACAAAPPPESTSTAPPPAAPVDDAPTAATSVVTASSPGGPAPTPAASMPSSWFEPYGDPADDGSVYAPACVEPRRAMDQLQMGPESHDEATARAEVERAAAALRHALDTVGTAGSDVLRAADTVIAAEGDVAAAFVRFAQDRSPATLTAMEQATAVTAGAKRTIVEFLDVECPAVGHDDALGAPAPTEETGRTIAPAITDPEGTEPAAPVTEPASSPPTTG